MNTECTLNQLRGLMQLLRTDDSDSSSSDDEPITTTKKTLGPGDISSKKTPENPAPSVSSSTNKLESEIKTPSCCTTIEPQNLEEWEKMQEDEKSLLDTRQEPEYTFAYKQSVTTEDLYLGMNNKNASTASCEDMILEIKLPGETATIEEMELTITENMVDFASPKFKAKIPLPYSVDPNKGKATYNGEYNLLKLVLRMTRELDFINF
uniref:CSON012942 protein n=1 Tax=Culicoides sonorensis TaxID=179676 RepID=A0A336KKZ5_CULSO